MAGFTSIRRSSKLISIDLDQQNPEGFQVASSSTLIQKSSDANSKYQDLSALPKPIKTVTAKNADAPVSKESKKLSIVLTKDMHRRAKMQAVQEDITLKDLVVRLIEQHLDQE